MKTMTLKFQGIRCEINNEIIQKKIWNLIKKASGQISTRKYKHWTEEEDVILRESNGDLSKLKELSEKLERTEKSIIMRLHQLGISTLEKNKVVI